MTLFSEKVVISYRCISGLMSNLIKKSWTDSNAGNTVRYDLDLDLKLPFIQVIHNENDSIKSKSNNVTVVHILFSNSSLSLLLIMLPKSM